MEANEMLPQVFLSGPLFAADLARALGIRRFVVHLARVFARALAITRRFLRQRHEIRDRFLGRQLQIDVLEQIEVRNVQIGFVRQRHRFLSLNLIIVLQMRLQNRCRDIIRGVESAYRVSSRARVDVIPK